MNRQETFDFIVDRMREQGRPSVVYVTAPMPLCGTPNVRVDCYYRHPDDDEIRCPVGHCIADEDYEPAFEGKPLLNDRDVNAQTTEIEHRIRAAVLKNCDEVDVAVRLQWLHDTWGTAANNHPAGIEHFEAGCRSLAHDLGLEYHVREVIGA